jgi:hypothetical protein
MATKTAAKPAKPQNKNQSIPAEKAPQPSTQTPAYLRKGQAAPAAQPNQVSDKAPSPVVNGNPSKGVRFLHMNDVRVMGRLTRDADFREFQGRAVANFSVATEKPYKDKDDKLTFPPKTGPLAS